MARVLHQHLINVHDKHAKGYMCTFFSCNAVFASKQSYEKHLAGHQSQGNSGINNNISNNNNNSYNNHNNWYAEHQVQGPNIPWYHQSVQHQVQGLITSWDHQVIAHRGQGPITSWDHGVDHQSQVSFIPWHQDNCHYQDQFPAPPGQGSYIPVHQEKNAKKPRKPKKVKVSAISPKMDQLR